jgi:preprotein translocase subunit YajC
VLFDFFALHLRIGVTYFHSRSQLRRMLRPLRLIREMHPRDAVVSASCAGIMPSIADVTDASAFVTSGTRLPAAGETRPFQSLP